MGLSQRPTGRKAQARQQGPEGQPGAAPWPGGRLGVKTGLFPQPPPPPGPAGPAHTRRMRSVSGSSSSLRIFSSSAGSMAAAEPPLQRRVGRAGVG